MVSMQICSDLRSTVLRQLFHFLSSTLIELQLSLSSLNLPVSCCLMLQSLPFWRALLCVTFPIDYCKSWPLAQIWTDTLWPVSLQRQDRGARVLWLQADTELLPRLETKCWGEQQLQVSWVCLTWPGVPGARASGTNREACGLVVLILVTGSRPVGLDPFGICISDTLHII